MHHLIMMVVQNCRHVVLHNNSNNKHNNLKDNVWQIVSDQVG